MRRSAHRCKAEDDQQHDPQLSLEQMPEHRDYLQRQSSETRSNHFIAPPLFVKRESGFGAGFSRQCPES
jgi:hypothetical protein